MRLTVLSYEDLLEKIKYREHTSSIYAITRISENTQPKLIRVNDMTPVDLQNAEGFVMLEIDEHSEEKEGTIETYCNRKCDFNEGGICRCNWLRIYEGECDSYQWTNEMSRFK